MTPSLKRLGWIVAFGLTLLIGFSGGIVVSQRAVNPSPESLAATWRALRPSPAAAQLGNLEKIWREIHTQYVETNVDNTQLMDGALGGLVAGLGDPYSSYFSPAEAKEFQQELAGTFEGIGMEIGYKNTDLVVISPLPNQPAAKAGIEAGDLLQSIDGQDVVGWKLEQAVKALRGAAGTKVKVVVRRGDETETRLFTITRATITVQPVDAKTLTVGQKHFGYIRINNFNDSTNTLFQQAARSLLSQNVDGYILDLRNNPGGLLSQSVKIISTFVDHGPVVIEQYRLGDRKNLDVDGSAYILKPLVVVLVNGGSASASEIVAGALQDTGRATIIGTVSFGKGSVQDYQELPGGASLKLTVAKWLTPKGRSISAHGITPDIIIDMTAADREQGRDPQLDRATQWLNEHQ